MRDKLHFNSPRNKAPAVITVEYIWRRSFRDAFTAGGRYLSAFQVKSVRSGLEILVVVAEI